MNSTIIRSSSNLLFRNVLNKNNKLVKYTVPSFRYYSNNKNNYNNNDKQQQQQNSNKFKDYMTYGIIGSLSLIVPTGVVFCIECFEEDDEFITQIKTGFKFPKILNSDYPYSIVNIGNRKLSFINIDVYSIGFYINKDNAKSKLSKELIKLNKQEFCGNRVQVAQDILDKGIGLTIKIRPTRRVTWGHIYSGFQRSLIIMLLKKYDMPLNEIEVLMDQLKSALKQHQEITTTESIDFIKKDHSSSLDSSSTLDSSNNSHSDNQQSLIVLFNNKQVLEIKDKRLANCFFDFYLGDNTKTPEARNHFFENLYHLINNDNNLNSNIHATHLSPI